MDLIPAIDIRGGNAVQLVQGDYERETVFGDDPEAMALRWIGEGARRLHIVDLDGAKAGHPVNDKPIAAIAQASRPFIRVQVAGGVRDAAAIDRWVETGADRVVVGTMAVEQPDAVEAAIRKHGDKIAIALDVRDGKPATRGWLGSGDESADAFLRDMVRRGAMHFIYTDIARDGMLQHLDFNELRRVIDVLDGTGAPATLIYSGGVTSVEDVVALNEFGIEGAIIGTALYDGRLEFKRALRALATGDGTS
jgi:phosphoribosylformimino-5-aminoimidazole carboxamide ribotide isomerase